MATNEDFIIPEIENKLNMEMGWGERADIPFKSGGVHANSLIGTYNAKSVTSTEEKEATVENKAEEK